MTVPPTPIPHPFTRKDFTAECREYPDGSRCICIYDKRLTDYQGVKAFLRDPVAIFKFAGWMVKASEWVGEQKILKVKKKNRNKIQPTKD